MSLPTRRMGNEICTYINSAEVVRNMNENYKVYMHIFPNGKKYIGITKQSLKERFDSGYGYKIPPMKNAIQKYGWENVEHKLLFDKLTKEEAYQKEIELIEIYQTTNPQYGYNISKGGTGSNGCVPSIETRLKMSKSHKGRVFSQSSKDKISKSRRKDISGVKFSKLTPIYPIRENGKLFWVCICDCGKEIKARADHILQGKTQSCGCIRTQKLIERNKEKKYEVNTNIH